MPKYGVQYLCSRRSVRKNFKEVSMLYTIAVVLLILWALGQVSFGAMGGLIHILLVVAIVMILLRLITGKRV